MVPGLSVQNTYVTLRNGSKYVSFVLRNETDEPIHLSKQQYIAQLVAGDILPKPLLRPEPTPEDDRPEPMSVRKRRRLLLELLDLSGLDLWTEGNKLRAKRLLQEYHDVFSLEPHELGCTSAVEHTITLTDPAPFKERFRRLPPTRVEEVRQALSDMLNSGAIRPSQSPWCNAVVLVRKKDGTLRFCIDFRRLNERTKKDSYPLPRISETYDAMRGAGHFSCLDLKSGFWQVRMAEASKQYTAFTVGNLGFYECERMPFGLCNAPATFQRLMQSCLGELNLTFCIIYLDDVIVFADTEETHLVRLRAVFERLREHNLKLKPTKCLFFKQEITYLAHHVSKEGIRPSQKYIEAVTKLPYPTDHTGVRHLLGLFGHYRRFIKDYAKKTKGLRRFLSGDHASKKKEPVELLDSDRAEIDALKTALVNSPCLMFADYSQPFLVETDASGDGLGTVLSQKRLRRALAPGRFWQ